MYCPRCSQPQNSDEIRFCPGCGLQLTLVRQLVATDGFQLVSDPQRQNRVALLQRPGIRPGAKLIFASAFLLPLAIAFSIGVDSPGPLVIPFIIFVLGLAKVLYTLLFGERERPQTIKHPTELSAIKHRLDLPEARNIPTTQTRRIQTAEIVSPPSVTENTTRLLDEDR